VRNFYFEKTPEQYWTDKVWECVAMYYNDADIVHEIWMEEWRKHDERMSHSGVREPAKKFCNVWN
jgi:hypothetical protein